jgi:glutamate dehydrogenase (NAD(P)+)
VVPAALEGAIDARGAEAMTATIVVEAANGPTTPDADLILNKKGVTVVPDILANAGGVTASYFEWAQSRSGFPWDEETIASRLAAIMDDAFDAVWRRSTSLGVSMRRAAGALALERVGEAFSARGLFP